MYPKFSLVLIIADSIGHKYKGPGLTTLMSWTVAIQVL